jgi:hypothetical protein
LRNSSRATRSSADFDLRRRTIAAGSGRKAEKEVL